MSLTCSKEQLRYLHQFRAKKILEMNLKILVEHSLNLLEYLLLEQDKQEPMYFMVVVVLMIFKQTIILNLDFIKMVVDLDLMQGILMLVERIK